MRGMTNSVEGNPLYSTFQNSDEGHLSITLFSLFISEKIEKESRDR